MNKFRAILINGNLSISEANDRGDVVRHVVTIPNANLPQFFDDMLKARAEFKPTLLGLPVQVDNSLPPDEIRLFGRPVKEVDHMGVDVGDLKFGDLSAYMTFGFKEEE